MDISICKIGLYNLNDSVEGPATFTFLSAEDFLDELKLLQGIFVTNYNDFFIFQIFQFIVSDFKCHFIFQIFWGVLNSEDLRILKSCGIKGPHILRISKS